MNLFLLHIFEKILQDINKFHIFMNYIAETEKHMDSIFLCGKFLLIL